ncbi:hypothetical protein QQP08_014800 [Theobroma cacao]|nr:hypothetical protein QQP08_014800 [Theobroma cacao]
MAFPRMHAPFGGSKSQISSRDQRRPFYTYLPGKGIPGGLRRRANAGARIRPTEQQQLLPVGIITKEEIQRCIREIMEGDKIKDIKRNAEKWKTLAVEAVNVGGSSDKNIREFVAKLKCN